MWRPGRSEIVVNDRADKSTQLSHVSSNAISIPYNGFRTFKKYIALHIWQK